MIGAWQWIIILTVFLLPAIVLPIWALIYISKSSFTNNNKTLWVLAVIFFNFIGSLLYFTIGRQQKIKNAEA